MIRRTVAAALGLAVATSLASAAEMSARRIEGEPHDRIEIRIDGPLVPGDTDGLIERLREIDFEGGNFSGVRALATVSGTGGSHDEGVGLARLFRDYHIETTIASGAECSGPCGIAFLGGTVGFSIRAWGPSRSVVPGSRLHLAVPEPESPSAASNDRGAVIAAHDRLTARIAELMALLAEFEVSPTLLQRVLVQGRQAPLALSTVDDLGRARIPVSSLQISRITLPMVANYCRNGLSWSAGGLERGDDLFSTEDVVNWRDEIRVGPVRDRKAMSGGVGPSPSLRRTRRYRACRRCSPSCSAGLRCRSRPALDKHL